MLTGPRFILFRSLAKCVLGRTSAGEALTKVHQANIWHESSPAVA